MFVEFRDRNGNRLVINPADISTIYESDDGAEVYMAGNPQPIYLDVPFDEAVEKLSAS